MKETGHLTTVIMNDAGDTGEHVGTMYKAEDGWKFLSNTLPGRGPSDTVGY